MDRKKKIFSDKDRHYPNDKITEAREEVLKAFNPASSVSDCTGLIPFEVQDDSQIESYREIINFTPPENMNKTE